MHDGDADAAEMLRIAHTRQLQDVRRADRAGRQDHLARSVGPLGMTVPPELDADRALAVEQHAMDKRVRHELQVGALQGRTQIGARGAGAAAAAAGLLTPADAVAMTRRQIVDVLAIFEPELLAGLEDRGADRW